MTGALPGSMVRPLRALSRPVDIAPLVFFRIVGGFLMTAETVGQLVTDYSDAYTGGAMHFSYLFLPWLEPWPPVGVYAHFAFNIVSGLLVTVGLFYRAAAVAFFLGTTSLFLMEKAVYINHTYLYCLVAFLLIFMPCNRALSLDAIRRPEISRATAPAWCLFLLRFQMAIVYLYAGLAKLDPDWLAGMPFEVWLTRFTQYPIVGPVLSAAWTAQALSWGGLVVDLLIVPALLLSRTRAIAFCAVATFHLPNVAMFGLGSFPWFALTMTTLFFEPETFRRLPLLSSALPVRAAASAGDDSTGGGLSRLGAGALAAYCAVQLLVPLRGYAYPGRSVWTEEGHTFAWHMMLRAKLGGVGFTVRDPGTGQTWEEHPRDYLVTRQYRNMYDKPDLILQFAHFLASQYRARGHEAVEVRARALCSLNGRPRRLLVKPGVDLAAEKRTLAPYAWIAAGPAAGGSGLARRSVDQR